jgi:hypothetical protein
MKRLFYDRASCLVNQTVLDYFEIKLNKQKDLANLDKIATHAIKQAILFVLKHRHPDAEKWIVELMANSILRYVMHLEPQIVREETKEDAQVLLWGSIVKALREFSIKKCAGSSLPNDVIISYVVKEIIIGLEKLIME